MIEPLTRWHAINATNHETLWVGLDQYVSHNAIASVCIVHGFRAWHRWGFFPFVAEHCARNGFTTGVVALPSSGYTPDGFSATHFAHATLSDDRSGLKWALDQLRKLRLPLAGLGHSRGGLLLLLEHTQLDAVVMWAPPASLVRWTQRQQEHWRRDGSLPAGSHPATGETLVIDRAVLDDALTRDYDGQLAHALKTCQIPVCLITGKQDIVALPRDAEYLALRLPNSTVHTIEATGHTFGISHPMHERTPALEQALQITLAFLCSRLDREL